MFALIDTERQKVIQISEKIFQVHQLLMWIDLKDNSDCVNRGYCYRDDKFYTPKIKTPNNHIEIVDGKIQVKS
jgi:hypothetical protein